LNGVAPILARNRTQTARESITVSVQFLSTDWAEALKAHLNGNDAFKQAAQGQNATIQQVITGDDGETLYWIRIADAAIDMGVGQAENPDATITQSYETAVALAKSELSPVTAFMTGKVKVGGNMGLLLSLQGVLTQLPDAMRAIDVQY
jgi:putative sterol carrier protein